MREALASMRVPGAYEPGRWCVSKYNRVPEVVDAFPKSIKLRDITLRTMEQMHGVAPSPEDRKRLLRAIVAAGVKSIEASNFRRGHENQMVDERDAIREVDPDCELIYGAVSSEGEIALAAESGYDAVTVSSAYLGAAAPSCAGAVYHRAWKDREWRNLNFPKRPEDQVERSVRFIELGKKHGVRVHGGVNLLALSDESYVDLYCRTVAEAGADEITLADGSSGVGPEAFGHLVRVAKAAAPNCTITVHTHNMFGLSMSCALEAVKAGAGIIEVSVNEYDVHAGNPDLAVVAAAFEVVYGVETGIDLSQMFPLARLGEEISGYQLQWNHPITGLFAYDNSVGDAYTQQHLVDPLIHSALTPEAVGGHPQRGIGLTTGPFTMWDKLIELGLEVDSKRMVEEILASCKSRLRAKSRPLSNDDIVAIALELGADRLADSSSEISEIAQG